MKPIIVAFLVSAVVNFAAGWWLSGNGIGFWQRQSVLVPLSFIGGLMYGQHERLKHQQRPRRTLLNCVFCVDSDEFTLDELAHHLRLFHPDQWEVANDKT